MLQLKCTGMIFLVILKSIFSHEVACCANSREAVSPESLDAKL